MRGEVEHGVDADGLLEDAQHDADEDHQPAVREEPLGLFVGRGLDFGEDGPGLPLFEQFAFASVIGSIAFCEHLAVGRVVEDVSRNQQRTGHDVHRCDVGDEKIFGVGRVAAGLSIEIRAAALQTASANDDHHRLHHFIEVDGELVGIPAILIVAAVGVDRAEHASIDGALQFVLERVTGQRGVVHLDVDLEILLQPVCA